MVGGDVLVPAVILLEIVRPYLYRWLCKLVYMDIGCDAGRKRIPPFEENARLLRTTSPRALGRSGDARDVKSSGNKDFLQRSKSQLQFLKPFRIQQLRDCSCQNVLNRIL